VDLHCVGGEIQVYQHMQRRKFVCACGFLQVVNLYFGCISGANFQAAFWNLNLNNVESGYSLKVV